MEKLQDTISYKFNNIELLQIALTHSSFSSEAGLEYTCNYERLEFIGDGFLDAIVGAKLFEIMPNEHEGAMSRNRSFVVCEESLAEIARSISIGDYLRLGRGEENSGGRDKDSILSDVLEAIIGAIFIDGGYEEAKRITLNLLNEKIIKAAEGKLDHDYKSRLQEIVQSHIKGTKLQYTTLKTEGPDHDKKFTVSVSIDGKVLGKGIGKSKAKAEQAAAKDAIMKGELQFVF